MIFANRTDDFQAACSLDPDQTAPMSDLGPNYLQSWQQPEQQVTLKTTFLD